MKKVIRCDETVIHSGAPWNSLRYTFVNTDDNTPQTCTLRVGDLDPVTGEEITARLVSICQQLHNREVYYNRRACFAPWSFREREARRRDRQQIAAEFERSYGYPPNPQTLAYLLEQRWGPRHCIHIDALTDGDGSSYVDSFLPPPCNSVEDELFGTEDDEIARLRDFEEMLSGRLLDVFHLMLDRKSGGADHERVRTVALRWNVTERTVFNDEKRLKEMIMEFFEESSPVSAV